VSAPLEWDEVKKKKVRPQDYTIKTIFKRLDTKGDLFEGFFKHRQSIAKAVGKLSEMMGDE
jgi:bifunctional non-homologous end joining protein LigD